METYLATAQKDFESEKIAKSLLEAKIVSMLAKESHENATTDNEINGLNDSEEVQRLNEELSKLQARFDEQLQFEETQRIESISQWKVGLKKSINNLVRSLKC